MSRLRQSDDGWDIAGSVGATAVMFAAGRAAETAQVATSTDDRLEDDAVESVLAHLFPAPRNGSQLFDGGQGRLEGVVFAD